MSYVLLLGHKGNTIIKIIITLFVLLTHPPSHYKHTSGSPQLQYCSHHQICQHTTAPQGLLVSLCFQHCSRCAGLFSVLKCYIIIIIIMSQFHVQTRNLRFVHGFHVSTTTYVICLRQEFLHGQDGHGQGKLWVLITTYHSQEISLTL